MARNKYDIDEDLKSSFNFKHVKRVLRYLKPYKFRFAGILALTLFSTILGLFSPLLTRDAIDNAIPNGDLSRVLYLTLFTFIILIVNALCMGIRVYVLNYVGQKIISDLRRDLFVHLQSLPFSYYDSRPHGKILVRVVNYINSLSDLLSNGVINMITEMISLVLIVAFMIYVDPMLTLVALVLVPLLILGIGVFKTSQRNARQKFSRKSSNLNAYIHESITGIKETRSFARSEENTRICIEQSKEYRNAWLKAILLSMSIWPMIDTISTASTIMLYWFGIMRFGSSVGSIIAMAGYSSRFWNPIMTLTSVYNSILEAMAYLERIFETIDEDPIVFDNSGAAELPAVSGGIEFKNVSFSYDKDTQVLKDVNFTVNPGESVALVGPTGAGKTTIVNLLSRFYDVTDGQVLIDGYDVRNVTLDSLRNQMGVMLQDTFIFSGTIKDNIIYSKRDATEEEMLAASKTVLCDEFVKSLPQGYNTEVNERGSRLSVGQRQLLSFARALLADPRILILDEATSSIDTATEKIVQKGLNNLLKGRTSFVIAHRLSTIKNADKIMYIDGGHIEEMGTHDELMSLKGKYYDLYTAQYRMLEC